jgi:hypothetical protein
MKARHVAVLTLWAELSGCGSRLLRGWSFLDWFALVLIVLVIATHTYQSALTVADSLGLLAQAPGIPDQPRPVRKHRAHQAPSPRCRARRPQNPRSPCRDAFYRSPRAACLAILVA